MRVRDNREEPACLRAHAGVLCAGYHRCACAARLTITARLALGRPIVGSHLRRSRSARPGRSLLRWRAGVAP